MFRRSYPFLAIAIALVVWMTMDCQTQATPSEVLDMLTAPAPAVDDPGAEQLGAEQLSAEQKALLEFLQHDGMAALICYGGYVIVPPPPPTGVNNPPPNGSPPNGLPPNDNTGGNPPPPDDPGFPPPHSWPPDGGVPPPNGGDPPPFDDSGGGNPPGPSDEIPFPPEEPFPEHLPEPGSIVLGLVGIGVTSLSYLRRRGKGKQAAQP